MLVALSSTDAFRVTPGEPDPRSWPVILGDARRAGTVEDLLVDTEACKVCYLVTALDPEPGAESGRDRVLLPIGFVRLDEQKSEAIVDLITTDRISRLPAFTGLPLYDGCERDLEAVFTGSEEASGRG